MLTLKGYTKILLILFSLINFVDTLMQFKSILGFILKIHIYQTFLYPILDLFQI